MTRHSRPGLHSHIPSVRHWRYCVSRLFPCRQQVSVPFEIEVPVNYEEEIDFLFCKKSSIVDTTCISRGSISSCDARPSMDARERPLRTAPKIFDSPVLRSYLLGT